MMASSKSWSHMTMLALFVVAISPIGVLADTACVCVEHVKTEQTLLGCRLSQNKNDLFPTALFCRTDDVPLHAPITVDDTNYRLVPAGKGRCDPCEPVTRAADTILRWENRVSIKRAGEGTVE